MEVNTGKRNAKMGSKFGPDWTELTWDCLIDIFSRLSMKQRWIAPMLVCKTWMNVCKYPSLSSVFDLESWFQSSTESRNWWTSEFSEKVNSTLMYVVERSKGGLTEIRIRHCTDRSLLYVADRNCKNLQIMKRNFTHPSEVSRFESYKNYVENIDAYIIGRHMHQLKHLELRFSTMTDKGLAFLCKQCPNLEHLDLFGCRNLTSDGVTNATSSLKNLKKINKPILTALFFY